MTLRDDLLSLLEDFDGAPYPGEVQEAFRLRMEQALDEIDALESALRSAESAHLPRGFRAHNQGDRA